MQKMAVDKPWIYEQVMVAIEEKKLQNVCRSHGLVIDKDDTRTHRTRFLGVLLVYIDHKGTLYDVAPKCEDQGQLLRWADDLKTMVDNMHKMGLVWGDAKPQNVLVDHGDKLWIIDVDGGYTPPWVDEDRRNTKEGDLQGLDNTKRWLASLTEETTEN